MKAFFYLVDTVIVIDHLNGIVAASDWLETEASDRAVISVITRAEVLAGADEGEQERAQALLGSFECLAIGVSEADKAAELRREHRWKLPDAFQAALAEIDGLKLATRNTKDAKAGTSTASGMWNICFLSILKLSLRSHTM